MIAYTLIVMLATLVLGVAVNGAWLYVTAAAFGWLVVLACLWVGAMATGRTGFFGPDRRF